MWALSSCSLGSQQVCKSFIIDSENNLDSIQSGLEIESGIYKVSLEIKGELSEAITIWGTDLKSGEVDTIIGPTDYFIPNFVYLVKNPKNGTGELELCVTFYH